MFFQTDTISCFPVKEIDLDILLIFDSLRRNPTVTHQRQVVLVKLDISGEKGDHILQESTEDAADQETSIDIDSRNQHSTSNISEIPLKMSDEGENLHRKSSISYLKRLSSLSLLKTSDSKTMPKILSQASLKSNVTCTSIPIYHLPVTNGIVDIQRTECPPSYPSDQ